MYLKMVAGICFTQNYQKIQPRLTSLILSIKGEVMEIKQLNPAEVIRDETGSWIHPEYLAYLNTLNDDSDFISNDDWVELKRHFNVETITLWMESSVSSDDWESMMDDCDITKWNPIAPHGFFLIDIGFSEDDAYAIFARPKRVSEVA